MNNMRVGLLETVGIVSTVIISKIFYTSLMMIIKISATAAWYITIISCITSIVFFLLICRLLNRFPDKELPEIFEKTIGKVPGKFLNIIFAFYFLYYASMNLREFVEIIKAISLPYTATSVIVAAFVIIVILMSFKGLEAIIRIAYMSFYAVVAGIFLILVLALPYYNIEYITPIGGNGVLNSLKLGIMRCSAYDEIILLAFFANNIKGLKNLKKAGIISLIISGIIFSICIICNIMAFGYTVAGENLSDMFMLSRLIYFSRFFQRIDAIFLFIWVISSVITVGVSFFFTLKIYTKSFEIKNHKPLIFPFAILLFTITMIPRDISEIVDIHMLVIKQYSFILIYCIPVLILLISLIFGKRGDKVEKTKI